MCIPSFILIGCCVSGLNLHPYRDVWPEAVYCYFTKTTLFAYLELEVAITSQSFVALHFPVYEIAKCIA